MEGFADYVSPVSPQRLELQGRRNLSFMLRIGPPVLSSTAGSTRCQYTVVQSHLPCTSRIPQRLELSAFDPDNSGGLTTEALEDYVRSLVDGIAALGEMQVKGAGARGVGGKTQRSKAGAGTRGWGAQPGGRHCGAGRDAGKGGRGVLEGVEESGKAGAGARRWGGQPGQGRGRRGGVGSLVDGIAVAGRHAGGGGGVGRGSGKAGAWARGWGGQPGGRCSPTGRHAGGEVVWGCRGVSATGTSRSCCDGTLHKTLWGSGERRLPCTPVLLTPMFCPCPRSPPSWTTTAASPCASCCSSTARTAAYARGTWSTASCCRWGMSGWGGAREVCSSVR